MKSIRTILLTLAALAACRALAASTVQPHQRADVALPEGFWFESLTASVEQAEATDDDPNAHVPEVFHNGAWTADRSTSLNAYVAALLSKDVYFKHVIDPRGSAAARRNFTLFTRLFCRSMTRLGADDCEVVAGPESLVWAVVRAGPSVLLVVRGSNTPQNWIADVTSLRTTNVADFGGGPRGTNVALGFYKVFSANRDVMVDRVSQAMVRASAAAAAVRASVSGRVDDSTRLWVFGHSLGGAVALMAASYMDVRKGLTATGVYTYGCPRVGDESWAESYQLHDATLRLENAGDIIPTLPFGITWRHVGTAVAIQACKGLPQMLTLAGVEGKAMTEAEAAAATDVRDGDRLARRLLRGAVDAEGAEAMSAAGLYDGRTEDAKTVLTAEAVEEELKFPFPVSFRDHWVQTYVQVLWSCLPEDQQELVPGPEDVYDKLVDAADHIMLYHYV